MEAARLGVSKPIPPVFSIYRDKFYVPENIETLVSTFGRAEADIGTGMGVILVRSSKLDVEHSTALSFRNGKFSVPSASPSLSENSSTQVP